MCDRGLWLNPCLLTLQGYLFILTGAKQSWELGPVVSGDSWDNDIQDTSMAGLSWTCRAQRPQDSWRGGSPDGRAAWRHCRLCFFAGHQPSCQETWQAFDRTCSSCSQVIYWSPHGCQFWGFVLFWPQILIWGLKKLPKQKFIYIWNFPQKFLVLLNPYCAQIPLPCNFFPIHVLGSCISISRTP